MKKLIAVMALVVSALCAAPVVSAQDPGLWFQPQPRPVRFDPYTGQLYDATGEMVPELNAALAAHVADGIIATFRAGPATPRYFDGVAPQYRQQPAPQQQTRPAPAPGPVPQEQQRTEGSALYINRTDKAGPGCDFPIVFFFQGRLLRSADGTPVQLLPGQRATLPGEHMIIAAVVGETYCEVGTTQLMGGAARVVRNLPATCRDLRK